jgi:sRNA-binding protein
MQVNDGGTASFFAVLKKSSADQKARIEKKAEEKKAEKKEAEKKAEKKEKEERLEKAREADDDTSVDDEDTVIITANSIEELIQKINDYSMEERSNSVLTDYEKTIGQNIDFRG